MAWDKSFLKGLEVGAELGFKRWKEKRENDPKTIAAKARAQVEGMLAAYGIQPAGMGEPTVPPAGGNLMTGGGIPQQTIPPEVMMAGMGGGTGGAVNPMMMGNMMMTGISGGKPKFGVNPLAQKMAEQQISSQGQVASQEMKESEKKQRDLRRVQLKLDQSTDLLARSYQKTQMTLEAAGIPLKAGKGLSGRAFGVAQKVMSKTGYNEYVKSYTGNLNEAAIALMRMAMPGRSERMVNLYKKTLPDMTGNPYEDISQVAESMTAAYGDALATQKDSSGKAKYSVAEARELRNTFKSGAYDRLKGVFIKAGLLTPEEAATIKSTSALKTNDVDVLKKLKLDPKKYELVR